MHGGASGKYRQLFRTVLRPFFVDYHFGSCHYCTVVQGRAICNFVGLSCGHFLAISIRVISFSHAGARGNYRQFFRTVLRPRMYVCMYVCIYIYRCMGPSWVHFGAILKVSWGLLGDILGPSWGYFGPSWGHLGPTSSIMDHLRPSWDHLAPKTGPRYAEVRRVRGASRGASGG